MMLAGNHTECADDVYSYADLPSLQQQTARSSVSKQSATSDTSQPHRNSQTRRALRLRDSTENTIKTREIYSAPHDTMGNTESDEGNPISYHAGAYNTHVHDVGQFISGSNCCDDLPTPVNRSVIPDSSVSADKRVTKTRQVKNVKRVM